MAEAIPAPKTAEPHLVANVLAQIEDDLAHLQNHHAELNGKVKRAEKFFETYEATLYEMVDPDSCAGPQERAKFAKADLHKSAEWTEHLDDIEELEMMRKLLDYLDIRRSICQSILRRGQDPGDEIGRHGAGRGQAGHHA